MKDIVIVCFIAANKKFKEYLDSKKKKLNSLYTYYMTFYLEKQGINKIVSDLINKFIKLVGHKLFI